MLWSIARVWNGVDWWVSLLFEIETNLTFVWQTIRGARWRASIDRLNWHAVVARVTVRAACKRWRSRLVGRQSAGSCKSRTCVIPSFKYAMPRRKWCWRSKGLFAPFRAAMILTLRFHKWSVIKSLTWIGANQWWHWSWKNHKTMVGSSARGFYRFGQFWSQLPNGSRRPVQGDPVGGCFPHCKSSVAVA